MKKSTIVICLLMYGSVNMYSQKLTISGYVSDASNNERLINATILSMDKNRVCSTNEQGFYSLTLEKGRVSLQASYVGFKPGLLNCLLHNDTVVNFSLMPNTSLDEVVITSNANRLPPGIQKIQMAQLSLLPSIAGETDVLKSLQLYPGVQSGTEGHTGLYIRGGEDYQNRVLLDGIPVFNSNHLFGFFSIFNENAIQDITIYKGTFPAKYGDCLSSVIDIQTKEGNGKRLSGSLSVGLLASTINLEGPLFNDKTTFFVSARQSYLDMLATPIIKYFTKYSAANYTFFDANAKITHRFNNKHKLIFSTYHSGDVGSTSNNDDSNATSSDYQWKESMSWSNHLYSLAWNYMVTPKVFINTIAHYSQYNYGSSSNNNFSTGTTFDNYQNDYESSIKDYELSSNVSWFSSNKYTLRSGAGYNIQEFLPGVTSQRLTNQVQTDESGNPVDLNVNQTIGDSKLRSFKTFFYLDNELKLLPNLTVYPGIRFTAYHTDKTYFRAEPRFNIDYGITNDLKADFSYVMANQFNHLLSSSRISQATDLWVPSNTQIEPEKSNQVSLSLQYNLSSQFVLTAEAYYKQMNHMVAYQEGASYLQSGSSWNDLVTFGSGKAKGIGVTLEKKTGKTTGWITYMYSRSTRKFEGINQGETFPFAYDRPHDLKLVVMHKFSSRFDINGSWVYHSGNRVTFGNVYETGLLNFETNDYKYLSGKVLYLQRNSYQLPAYHRLDVNFNYHIHTKRIEQVISIGVYNIYNRKNIYNIELVYDPLSYKKIPPTNPYYVKQQTLFPIIPSLSYRFTF